VVGARTGLDPAIDAIILPSSAAIESARMKKILVLDASQRSALAIIRSLGRRGIDVVAGDSSARPLAAASRFVCDRLQYTDPAQDAHSFRREVFSKARECGAEIIVPATDLTTMLLVGQHEQAAPVRIACPPPASYEALSDKGNLLGLARTAGVPVPKTVIAQSADAIRVAARELGFPVVLKPARSRFLANGRVFSTAVQIARDPSELELAITRIGWLDHLPCLAQEFIAGEGAGIFALRTAAGSIVWFAHRRIREKPPSGGVSVLSESVPVEPRMREFASRLLEASGWTGVAMIEFRVGVDGTPYLMEVNGRFWGSLQLAIDSGVDFPWLFCQLTAGEPLPAQVDYRVGRRLRWFLGDVDNLLIRLRARDARAGARLSAVGRFVADCFDPSIRPEIWRWSDPRPALREARAWLGGLIG
jgi:predicted ATP-grasp superfamily ATP-dependent carboligase